MRWNQIALRWFQSDIGSWRSLQQGSHLMWQWAKICVLTELLQIYQTLLQVATLDDLVLNCTKERII